MTRQPNLTARPVPAAYSTLPVPEQVRADSAAMEKARARYDQLRAELHTAQESIERAQAEDADAIRTAMDADQKRPKLKAPAAVERANRLEADVEAARRLAVEAEDRYLGAVREHRRAWVEELQGALEQLEADEDRAIDELRERKAARLNAEQMLRELDGIGDPEQIRRPARANEVAVLNFHAGRKLDPEDERRIEELRRPGVTRAA